MNTVSKFASIIFFAALSLVVASPATAKYPIARERPKLAAAKQDAARLEIPKSERVSAAGQADEVVRVDVDLPIGKVTERIHQRLESPNLTIIPSEMLNDHSVVDALRAVPVHATERPSARLVADNLIIVSVPGRNETHCIRFQSTGSQPQRRELESALASLPGEVYSQYGSVDALRWDGNEFSLEVQGSKVSLTFPELTRREQAGRSTEFAP